MASNATFTAENTEISERLSYSIRRTGSVYWDASLPWATLPDAISTLTTANGAATPSLTRGTYFQVSRIAGNYRPQALLQWLGTTTRVSILSIYVDEIPDLIAVLTALSSETDTPLDLDMSALSTLSTVVPSLNSLPINAADPAFGKLVADGDVNAVTGTDNLAVLTAASNAAAAQNRPLYIPAGTYRVSDTFPVPRVLVGDGPGVVTILCSKPDVPVAASRNWLTAFGGSPQGRGRVTGIRFCGAGVGGASTNHGFVLREYRTLVQNVTIMNCGGDGLHITHLDQGGSALAGTLVENTVRDLEVRSVAGTPVMAGPANNNKITDGFIEDVYLACQSTSPNALFVGSAAGWQIGEIHTYGTPSSHPIQILNGFRTMMGRLYVESWLSTANALRIQVQQDVTVESLATDFPAAGGTAVYVTRSAVYPLQTVTIGSLQLRMDADVACVAVQNTSSLISIQVDDLMKFGAFPSRIATQGGTSATDLVRVMLGARTSGGRTLVDRGDGTELSSAGAGYVTWSGNTAKSIVIPLPPIASFGKKTLIVSVISRSNHNGVSRAVWVGFVHISAKTNGTDAWVALQRDIVAASGFTVAPTVTVANTSGNNGEITVSFTATDSDGFGDVSALVS